jgi:hypothetical protein
VVRHVSPQNVVPASRQYKIPTKRVFPVKADIIIIIIIIIIIS